MPETETGPRLDQIDFNVVARLCADRTELELGDIAPMFGVQPAVVTRWRTKTTRVIDTGKPIPLDSGVLPLPDKQFGRKPIWFKGTLYRWGMQTGRMTWDGQPVRARPQGRPLAVKEVTSVVTQDVVAAVLDEAGMPLSTGQVAGRVRERIGNDEVVVTSAMVTPLLRDLAEAGHAVTAMGREGGLGAPNVRGGDRYWASTEEPARAVAAG